MLTNLETTHGSFEEAVFFMGIKAAGSRDPQQAAASGGGTLRGGNGAAKSEKIGGARSVLLVESE